MYIQINQFCYLSTSPSWLAWLHDFSSELYDGLVSHLNNRPSCKSNSNKMLQILDAITSSPDGRARLFDFLKRNFPHILSESPVSNAVGNTGGNQSSEAQGRPGPVFQHYDPDLLTVPRRRILRRSDYPDLEGAVRSFVSGKAASDFIIVGDAAYVEYLPASMASVVQSVPHGNWQIKAWREANSGKIKQ